MGWNTPDMGAKRVRKLLKSRDGLIDFSTHNPKVVSSNLPPRNQKSLPSQQLPRTPQPSEFVAFGTRFQEDCVSHRHLLTSRCF